MKDLLLAFLSLFALTASCLLWTRLSRPQGWVDRALLFLLYLTAHIVLIGNVLSLLDALGQLRAWTLGSGLALVITLLVALFHPTRRALALGALPRVPLADWWASYQALPGWKRAMLTTMGMVVGVIGLLNLSLVLFTAPHNWDSMTYHLARMAYFIQHGNHGYFQANYWAQVVHPRNSTLLLLYTYLIGQRNENLTQLVQYIAYWAALIGVFGIARRMGCGRAASFFAALTFGLLTEVLMEAITTQNDLLATAYVGAITYFLFSFRQTRAPRYLLLAGLALGLVLGLKTSLLLAFPALAVVALYALCARRAAPDPRLRSLGLLTVAGLAGFVVLALPSGYLDNLREFRHPVGPEEVRKLHAFEDVPLDKSLRWGTYNLLRYGFEFLSLDGLPQRTGPVDAIQWALRYLPTEATRLAGINLENQEAVRAPFSYSKGPVAHEDASYWGILGFALIWPVALWHLLGGGGRSPEGRVLALAAVLFVLAQAYSGPYDPWRGRYFIIAAVLAVPPVACCLQGRKSAWLRGYLLLIVLLGTLSGLTAVLLRVNSPILSLPGTTGSQRSVFELNRLEQLTRNRPNYLPPIRQFDAVVPQDATVAVLLVGDQFEYPLFGEGLTRQLLPVDPRWLYLPRNAEYFLFSNQLLGPVPTDRHLGEDWYLRNLAANR